MSFKFNFKTVVTAFFVLSLAFSIGTFAQEKNIIQTYKNLYQAKTPSLENWVNSNGESTVMMAINLIADVKSMPDDLLAGKTRDTNGNPIVWIPGGALGSTNQMIASLYQPPASGIEYIAQVKDSFLGKPAYAQSNTASIGLQPILPIWRAFRNAVYLLSSIFFIVIGMMIILRVKISPQAVITIQNAIPQLIITLILITFSYAIAGLMLDLSTLFQGMTVSILFSSLGKSPSDSLLTPGLIQWSANKIASLWGGTAIYSLNDLIANNGFLQTFDLVGRLLPVTSITLIGGIIGGILGGLFSGGVGIIPVAAAFSSVILLILLIFIMIKMIGFLFALVKAYVTILLKIIIAPLEIGMGAFPSSKAGFSSWFWDLLSQIAIFPICFIFLVLTNVIMETISQGALWTPPLLGIAGTVGGGASAIPGINLIGSMFGIGAFLLLSKLPELIPQVIFALKPSPYGQALGQAMDSIGKPVGRFISNATADKLGPKSKIGMTVDAYIPGVSQALSDTVRGK